LKRTGCKSGSAPKKGKEEFALSGLGKRLLAAAQVGPYGLPCCQEEFDLLLVA
jgi:hypothetical protein